MYSMHKINISHTNKSFLSNSLPITKSNENHLLPSFHPRNIIIKNLNKRALSSASSTFSSTGNVNIIMEILVDDRTDGNFHFSSWDEINDYIKEKSASSLDIKRWIHILRSICEIDTAESHETVTKLLNVIIKEIEEVTLDDIIEIYNSLSHNQYQLKHKSFDSYFNILLIEIMKC